MIARTTDPVFVGLCANHPGVRPHIGRVADGPQDFSAFLADPRNVALAVEGGCFLFDPSLGSGRWEVHTLLTPGHAGANVVPHARAAARWMFVNTDCLEIVTRLPASNRPADLMVRRVGFAPLFTRAQAGEDGTDLRFFHLTLDAWLGIDEGLEAEGRAFHLALEGAKALAGSSDPTHPDDAIHDRAVGAACLLAKAGAYDKAQWLYNRFAQLAGYTPVRIVPQPPLIDVGDALVRFNPDLEIVQCPPPR